MRLGVQVGAICIVGKRARVGGPVIRRALGLALSVRLKNDAIGLTQGSRHLPGDILLGGD